jgi:membrane associated rhomboid family serine protease
VGVDRRDYMYEDRDQRALAGWWHTAPVSHRLIVLNVAVLVLWLFPPLWPFLQANFTVSWEGVVHEWRVWTLLTYAFSHQGPWHLLWNMLYLHWFGPDLEQLYGRRNFLVLYLSGALVASLSHIVWVHHEGFDVPALGASGAVMAVVVVAALFFPHRTILMMFFLPVPLWLLACVKLVGDLAGVAQGGGSIAHAAHLGGAAAGLAFKVLDLRLFPSPAQSDDAETRGSRLAAGLRRLWPRRPAAVVDAPPPVDADTALQVDELLRKIGREGMASLTPDELAFLHAASARYRRR